jgi:2-polyprenyl-6-methoxyphenol hydroxylase-like FAD-dependent oxidoreductase
VNFPDRFGAPLLFMHRARLQACLLRAVGPSAVRLGAECLDATQDTEVANIRLADGSIQEGALIVGADGLCSTVRAALSADQAPSYSGLTAWRGVVPLDDALARRVRTGEFLGPGAVFGVASLSGSQAYWWASARQSESALTPLGATKPELLRRFSRWLDPIPELISATPEESIVRTLLYERPMRSTLASGRIALVGDAAHPMLPSLGQGACQAIEDAAELAVVLVQTQDIPDALMLFNARRAPHTRAVVLASRRMAGVAHRQNPLAVGIRNALMRATPSSRRLRRLSPILGHRVESDLRDCESQ